MIGFQCAPAAVKQVAIESAADGELEHEQSGASSPSPAPSLHQKPSLKRDQQQISDQMSGHVQNLGQVKRPASASSGQLVSSSHLLQGLQSAGSSPGYHSAGSSPSSSAASPVSVSSSSAGCPQGASASSQPAQQAGRAPTGQDGLLDFFPELNQDGLGLSWFHEANSRARLNLAVASEQLLVSGDISLAEMSRYPVPIMARPPLGVSDLTLENWLQELVHTKRQRGLKLTFTSTRTVEPAFRVLARHAEHLRGPLILNADILSVAAPGQAKSGKQQHQAAAQSQPVDAWTFLMLCRTRFPKCVISIGWCAAATASPAPLTDCPMSAPSPQSSESMFELELLDQVPGLAGLSAALQSSAGPPHQHQSLGHLQHLNHQLNRIHQHLHPYPLMSGAQRHYQQQQRDQPAIYAHLPMSANHHQLNQLVGQHLLSSTASLASASGSGSSSSGHSSGSPSPTSPVGHLMSPLLGGAGGSASAKSALAAMTAVQQLPLNLNINEAAAEPHSSNLGELAQRIQSIYRQQHNLSHTNKTNQRLGAPNEAPKQSQAANLSLQHIQKKAALGAGPHNGANLLLKTTQQHPPGSGHCSPAGYTREMIDKMAELVKEYKLSQPVTFPVQARMLKNSIGELQRLLSELGSNSTLTVIAQQEDLISVDDLLAIRRAFAANQLLFDVPDELAGLMRRELDLEANR